MHLSLGDCTDCVTDACLATYCLVIYESLCVNLCTCVLDEICLLKQSGEDNYVCFCVLSHFQLSSCAAFIIFFLMMRFCNAILAYKCAQTLK